jgi:malate dehydrogenase
MGIWGNHSDTMFPDFRHARVRGQAVTDLCDRAWLEGDFLKTVATRGKAIIEARGASSAASAAAAAVDHMSALWHGTAAGEFTSMAVCSNGAYGVPEGLIFSFPVTAKAGNWQIVSGLDRDAFGEARVAATIKELETERETVKDLLA